MRGSARDALDYIDRMCDSPTTTIDLSGAWQVVSINADGEVYVHHETGPAAELDLRHARLASDEGER